MNQHHVRRHQGTLCLSSSSFISCSRQNRPFVAAKLLSSALAYVFVPLFPGPRILQRIFLKKEALQAPARPVFTAATIQQLIRYQFIYSMTALILQLACMAIGGWLAYSGAVGHTSFAAQVLSEIGMKVQMSDAGPGTVLFLVGLLTLPFTRFNVRVDK